MKAETVISVVKIAGVMFVGYLAYGAVKRGTDAVAGITQTVRDTVGAVVDVVGSPVESTSDFFGIMPKQDRYGRTKWSPTTPWNNPDDVVSNGPGGINYNYF